MKQRTWVAKLFGGLTVAISTCASAQLAWQHQLHELIQQNLPQAQIGVMVMDANTGKILFEHDQYRAFTPASTVKLFSATAALAYLGKQFHFITRVGFNPKQLKHGVLKGNLFVEFTGDPSLTTKELRQLLSAVRKAGVSRIDGRVILVDQRYQGPNYAPGWTYDSVYWAFSAPITTVILNQNQVALKFEPSKTLGHPVKIVRGRRARFMPLHADVKTVTYQQAMHQCSLQLRVSDTNSIHLAGCWPDGSAGWQTIAVTNPALYASSVIQNDLSKLGIVFKGKVVTGYWAHGLKTVATHDSVPLPQLLHKMLKDSDNVYAESLTKTMGYYRSGHGTFMTGVNALKAEDNRLADIDFSQAVLKDGSGQSRYDLLQPQQVVKLLYAVDHNKKLHKLLINALPISGEDGTLKWRMRSDQMRGRVHAKTGSMSGVSALSGYLMTVDHHRLIFSIMMNNFVGKIDKARSLQDQMCEVMSQA